MHAAKTPDHGPPQPLFGAAAPSTAARILGDEEVADMVAQAQADSAEAEEIDPELEDLTEGEAS